MASSSAVVDWEKATIGDPLTEVMEFVLRDNR